MKTQTFEEWIKGRLLVCSNVHQLTNLLKEAYQVGYDSGHLDCANTISDVIKKLKCTGLPHLENQ